MEQCKQVQRMVQHAVDTAEIRLSEDTVIAAAMQEAPPERPSSSSRSAAGAIVTMLANMFTSRWFSELLVPTPLTCNGPDSPPLPAEAGDSSSLEAQPPDETQSNHASFDTTTGDVC